MKRKEHEAALGPLTPVRDLLSRIPDTDAETEHIASPELGKAPAKGALGMPPPIKAWAG